MFYIGNCVDEDLVERLFGSVSEFARLVEVHGDEFQLGNLTVRYNEDEDIHSFFETE